QYKNSHADPRGYRLVDLADRSFLEEIRQHWQLYRSLDYAPTDMHRHHFHGTHKYLISGSVLDADVLVNVPKLKTHGKCGVTCSLKNLVGINGDKAFLPHFRAGSPRENGDDYPVRSMVKRAHSHLRNRLLFTGHDIVWRSVRYLGKRAMKLVQQARPLPVV